jgi:hypothetical protein
MGAYSWALPLVPYGNRWKSSRRLLHEFLSAKATNNYDDQQHYYARDFILRIAESPDDLWDHIKLSVTLTLSVDQWLTQIFSTTGALLMSLTYGLDIKSHEDPFLSAAERALTVFEEVTVPGAFLVDTFPSRKSQIDSIISLSERHTK